VSATDVAGARVLLLIPAQTYRAGDFLAAARRMGLTVVVGSHGGAERAGTLQAVDGKAEAAAIPGITGLTITAPVGQRVHPLPEGDRYLGFIFAEADTPQDTAAALRAARSQLHLTIQ
jgi:hypothetical protein